MKSNWTIGLITVAYCGLFGLATGACTAKLTRNGAGDTITGLDGATLERSIAGWFAGRDLAVTVACPRVRPPKPGDTFTCDAIIEDGPALTIDVVQKDDQGNVTWRFDGVLLDTPRDLAKFKAELPTSVVITCPRRVLHLKQVGDTASCDLRDGDRRAQLVLRYDADDDSAETGSFSAKVVPARS